ncbi:MAG TPA: hypothetical protein VIC54_03570 [Terriglobales bacterium]|jgi:predicted nucleic acid-binding protein
MHDKVFLDANVLFSAAYDPGSDIAGLWQLSPVRLCTSRYAVEEARRNLDNAEERHRLDQMLGPMAEENELAPLPDHIALPAKDRPILQAAIQARATHLLTGDLRHFGALMGKRVGGVLILQPADYLAGHAPNQST